VLSSSYASGAPNNKCLSLLTRSGQYLDLEADTVEQLSSWLFGIQTVLSKSGKQCYVDTDTSNKPVQAPGQSKNKRFSILGNTLEGVEASRHAQFKRAILTIPRDENLRLMTQGSDYWVYTSDSTGQGQRQRMHVFYTPQTASLFWCELGQRKSDPKREISIHNITDLYVGKMSKVFKLPCASQAEKSKCITIQSTTNELNIEGDSMEQVTALLSGINHLLNSNGMQVLIEETPATVGGGSSPSSPTGTGDRRFSIMPKSPIQAVIEAEDDDDEDDASEDEEEEDEVAALPSALPTTVTSKRASIMSTKVTGLPSTAHETALGLNVKRRQSLLHLSTTETVRMLQDGRRFYRYFGQPPNIQKELITLFYVKEKNAFYWCQPGQRVQIEEQQLSLNTLTDVYLVSRPDRQPVTCER
jgi:hypothetical protein